MSPTFPMVQMCGHGPCSLRAVWTGVVLRFQGSMNSWARVCTTVPVRARRSAAVDVEWPSSGEGTRLAKRLIRFSRVRSSHVTLLVRGRSLEASMSQYLISQVREAWETSRFEQTCGCGRSRIRYSSTSAQPFRQEAALLRLSAEALFVCIGGVPRTQGATAVGLALDGAGYVRTGTELNPSDGALDKWPLSRQPLPLETNLPGLFAAGDVRSGSIKRCAAAIGEGSMAVALVHQRLAELDGE
jgi:thioredoxin reductase